MLLTGCQQHMKKNITTPAEPVSLSALLNSASGETHVIRLKNGLTVLIKEDDRFPLVNARLYVHAGSGYESPDQAGISHLLEHMVFKGTEKRGVGQSARDIESVGGSMNAATSFDYTMYYVEVPEERMAMGLDVITDMAFHAAIAPQELKSEKKVVLEELERGEDSPGSKLFKTLQGMVWKGSSYEWPIIGYRETVKSFTSQDIHDYINEFYQPQSMLLAVVGKVDPDAVLAEAERLLGGLENTRPVTPPLPIAIPAKGDGPRVTVLPGQWNKVYLGITFPLPGFSSAKAAGLDLLSQLMGGDDTSRLYRTFKYDRQLVDDISVYAMTLERGGMFYISATLDADKVETFWSELTKELASFDPGDFSDREIKRARLNLRGLLVPGQGDPVGTGQQKSPTSSSSRTASRQKRIISSNSPRRAATRCAICTGNSSARTGSPPACWSRRTPPSPQTLWSTPPGRDGPRTKRSTRRTPSPQTARTRSWTCPAEAGWCSCPTPPCPTPPCPCISPAGTACSRRTNRGSPL